MTANTPLQVRMLAALDRMEASPDTNRAASIGYLRRWLETHAELSPVELYQELRKMPPVYRYPPATKVLREVKWEAWREACGLARIKRAREQDAGATLFQGVR